MQFLKLPRLPLAPYLRIQPNRPCGREDLNLQQQPSQDCASANCATSAQESIGRDSNSRPQASETCALIPLSYRCEHADGGIRTHTFQVLSLVRLP
jgi:hypothetical protein